MVPGVILRTRGAHFSSLDGFGDIFGCPVGSKSDLGEHLSHFGWPKGTKSKPNLDNNGAQKEEQLKKLMLQKALFYLSKTCFF